MLESFFKRLRMFGRRENAALKSLSLTSGTLPIMVDYSIYRAPRCYGALRLETYYCSTAHPLSAKMLPWPYRLYFWGVHGVFIEIVFTGTWEFVVTGKWQLMGISSIWSFFIYGFGTFFFAEYLYNYLLALKVPLLARGVAYVLMTYTWEFSCGLVLDYFNARSWDYTPFDYDVMGLITLEYAPLWFLAGMYYECIMKVMLSLEETPRWKKSYHQY